MIFDIILLSFFFLKTPIFLGLFFEELKFLVSDTCLTKNLVWLA